MYVKAELLQELLKPFVIFIDRKNSNFEGGTLLAVDRIVFSDCTCSESALSCHFVVVYRRPPLEHRVYFTYNKYVNM